MLTNDSKLLATNSTSTSSYPQQYQPQHRPGQGVSQSQPQSSAPSPGNASGGSNPLTGYGNGYRQPLNGSPAPPRQVQANGNGIGNGFGQGQVFTPKHDSGPASTPTAAPAESAIDALEKASAGRKRKWGLMGYGAREMESMDRTATGFHLALLQDQATTLYPPRPKAFTSFDDVMNNLVPYHIWQIHDEELAGGKNEDPAGVAAREKAERTDAEDLLRRMTRINERLGRIRRRDIDSRNTPPFITMIKDSTSLIRDELSTIQARLRIVERERDILEAESRRRAAEKEREEREKARLAGIAAAAATAAANAKAMAAAAAAAKMKKQPKKDTITPTKANVPVTPQDRSVATTSRASTPLTDVGTARSTASPAPTQSTPKSFVDVGSTPAPNNADASSSVRGKARGRPRGRGRGGLREAVLTHTPGSQVASRGGSSHVTSPAPIGTNTSPTSGRTTRAGSVNDSNSGATPLTPSTSAAISAAQAPSTAGSGSKPGGSTAGHAATTQGPILLTINIKLVGAFVNLGLIAIPPAVYDRTKHPGSIVRRTDDEQGVVISLNLSMCTPAQLRSLGKLLNVKAPNESGSGVNGGSEGDTTAGGSGGPGGPGGSVSGAG